MFYRNFWSQSKSSAGILLALVLVALFSGCAIGGREAAWSGMEVQTAEWSGNPYEYMLTYDFGTSRRPIFLIEESIRTTQDEAGRLRIEKAILEVLEDEDATYAGRQSACRLLRFVGTEESVPALADLLTDPDLSHMARHALQYMETPKVDRALRKALDEVDGELAIGIVGTIGQRRDRGAVKVLAERLESEDPALVGAVVLALGHIGDEQASRALAEAGVPRSLRRELADARLMCADSLAEEGDVESAIRTYQDLIDPGAPGVIRIAALRGLARTVPEEAAPLMTQLLKDPDVDLRRAAARFVREMPPGAPVREIAETLSSLPSDAQVALVASLAAREDRAAAAGIAALSRSDSEEVRRASAEALRVLGDASSVQALAEIMAGGDAAAEAAAESLARLEGADIEKTILALLPKADTQVRVALVQSLGARRYSEAAPELMDRAQEDETPVREAAFEALGNVATEDHLPAMVALLKQTEDEQAREWAVRSLVATCQRLGGEDWHAQPLVNAMSVAEPAARASLASALGQLPSDLHFGILRSALDDESEEVRYAAIRALGGWPNDQPSATLFDIARSSDDLVAHVLALRGYVAIAGLSDQRPEEETRRMFETAMEAARRPEEQRTVLAGVADAAQEWSLPFAYAYVSDPELRSAARSAVDRVLESRGETLPHAAEGCPVKLANPFSEKYPGGGANALTDGLRGKLDFGQGHWQGFEGEDMDAVIDLGKTIDVQKVVAYFLRTEGPWIFQPVAVAFQVSSDGKEWKTLEKIDLGVPKEGSPNAIREFSATTSPMAARYVRVIAENIGTLPKWHGSAGGKAWVFCDEILVNPSYE